MAELAVVVGIPTDDEDGNMASAMVHRLPSEMIAQVLMHGRVRVFELGEILVLDEHGREVSGHGRKPDKWDVAVEYFGTDLAGAVAKAKEVTEK